MAARFRKVDPRTWDDEGFFSLPPPAKLLAIYIITAQSNRCGLFVYSHARAQEHVGINRDSYPIAFGKVCHTFNWTYHEASRTMYIPSWWKYNAPENAKHLKGCLTDLHDLPATPLLETFWKNTTHLPTHSIQAFEEAARIAMGIAMPYQEQEQEQEQEQKSRKRKAAAPPVVIPESLKTEPFLKAWAEWQEFRRQKKKPISAMAAAQQLKEFAQWGPDRAIESMHKSIRSDWQGVFEPEASNGNGHQPAVGPVGHSRAVKVPS